MEREEMNFHRKKITCIFKAINKRNFLFNCLFFFHARLAVNDLVPFIAPAFRVVSLYLPASSIVRGQIRWFSAVYSRAVISHKKH